MMRFVRVNVPVLGVLVETGAQANKSVDVSMMYGTPGEPCRTTKNCWPGNCPTPEGVSCGAAGASLNKVNESGGKVYWKAAPTPLKFVVAISWDPTPLCAALSCGMP